MLYSKKTYVHLNKMDEFLNLASSEARSDTEKKAFDFFIKFLSKKLLAEETLNASIKGFNEFYKEENIKFKMELLKDKENELGMEIVIESFNSKEKLEDFINTEKQIFFNIQATFDSLSIENTLEGTVKGLFAEFQKALNDYILLTKQQNKKLNQEEMVWFILVRIFDFDAIKIEETFNENKNKK